MSVPVKKKCKRCGVAVNQRIMHAHTNSYDCKRDEAFNRAKAGGYVLTPWLPNSPDVTYLEPLLHIHAELMKPFIEEFATGKPRNGPPWQEPLKQIWALDWWYETCLASRMLAVEKRIELLTKIKDRWLAGDHAGVEQVVAYIELLRE